MFKLTNTGLDVERCGSRRPPFDWSSPSIPKGKKQEQTAAPRANESWSTQSNELRVILLTSYIIIIIILYSSNIYLPCCECGEYHAETKPPNNHNNMKYYAFTQT